MTSSGPPLSTRIAVRARSPVGVGLTGKAVEALALCLFITVLPRTLGPEDFGRLALAVAVVQIAGASMSSGGPVTLSRFVPAQRGADRAAVARLLVGRMARWRLALLAAAAVIAAAFSLAVPERVPPGLAALLLAAIALDSTATLLAQAGLGLGRRALWSYRLPLQTSVLVVAALALVLPFGAAGAAAAVMVAAGVCALVAAIVVLPRLRGVRPASRLPEGVGRFAALQATSGFFTLLLARGGVVAVAWLHPSAAEVGYAGLAVGIALAGVYAVGQAFAAQLPGLAAQAVNDPGAAEARARRLARAGVLTLAPAILLAVVVLGPLLLFATGDRYRDAATAVAIALALVPLAPMSALIAQTAALRLRPQLTLKCSASAALVFCAVALAAVPPYGAAGASAAIVAGAATGVLVGTWLMPGAVPGRLLAVALVGAAAAVALAVLV